MARIDEIVEFSRHFEIGSVDASFRERATIAVLDTMASMYAGVTAAGVQELTSLADEWGGNPQATLVTTGRKTSVPLAALINGVAARGWDLDDVHEQFTCHVNASIVPAAMAIAEYLGDVDSEEVLASIILGAEFTCRMAASPMLSFSTTGMAMSYQCTVMGSTLTAARLLKLDHEQTLDALGIAYGRIAGNQQGYVDGAMTVRLMQGVSSDVGVSSAMMAKAGITAAGDVLEGKFGYFNVFQRGEYDPAPLTRDLGTYWEQANISIKPLYPCCKYTHGPIEATVEAVRKSGVTWGEIQKLAVTVTNKEVYDLVCLSRERKWHPTTVVDAQFSLPFTMAFAAINGNVDLSLLAPEARKDADVLALTQRVDAVLNLESQGSRRGTFPMAGTVTLQTMSGDETVVPFEFVKGHPNRPLSFDEVADKARACAAFGLPDWGGVETAIAAIRQMSGRYNSADMLPAAESFTGTGRLRSAS
ncbi:MAG: MmgE/PrpD family protein [Rhodospirillales bacterium]